MEVESTGQWSYGQTRLNGWTMDTTRCLFACIVHLFALYLSLARRPNVRGLVDIMFMTPPLPSFVSSLPYESRKCDIYISREL